MMKQAFKKILIANRGEIALRVIRTCREMGIKTVAVYSEGDRSGFHVERADEAYCIGPDPAANSYLNQEKLIEVAKKSGAEAIHPGFGFLSENAGFAQKIIDAGLIFIGPKPRSIDLMGLKDKSKELARQAQVPVIPGYQGEDQDPKVLEKKAKEIGIPLLIKASAGGGGKGMVVVYDFKEFQHSLEKAKREAKAAFGNDHVLLERYFPTSKHIEVQVFGDEHGNIVHLFERECSVQRRHQKIIEESPSPSLDGILRESICQAAVSLAKKVDYVSAGTVEFILDIATKEYYFLEMNTRLQVEHPVTEFVTGLDLVRLQLEVAMGLPLPFKQEDLKQSGHALECRLYAEDPKENFRPSPGEVYLFDVSGNGARNDYGLKKRDRISSYYDPMVAKIITYGKNRAESFQKMDLALAKTIFWGPPSNLYFLRHLVNHKLILENNFHTRTIEENFQKWRPQFNLQKTAAAWIAKEYMHWQQLSLPVGFRNIPAQLSEDCFDFEGQDFKVAYKFIKNERFIVNQQEYQIVELKQMEANQWSIILEAAEQLHQFQLFERALSGEHEKEIFIQTAGEESLVLKLKRRLSLASTSSHKGDYRAPMPGKVTKVLVKKGEHVKKGQRLLILEAMKMENEMTAFKDGEIEDVFVVANDQVEMGRTLLQLRGE